MENSFDNVIALMLEMEKRVKDDPQMTITYNLLGDIQLELRHIVNLLQNKSAILQYNTIPRLNRVCDQLSIIQDWLISRVSKGVK